ncbi:MAG: hypothetical protein H8D45_00390, partial [Bacteroidetes bacterium]|nr:hypothetical protein [Bacteroidota bacterium]
MKKIKLFIVVVLLASSLISFANNIDTGWLTFVQPNGVEFVGKGWGDEFEFYWETKGGYRFLKNYETDFWCYAVISSDGSFKSSNYAVGIIDPSLVGIEKKLQLSKEFKNVVKERRMRFEQHLEEMRNNINSTDGLFKASATRTVSVDLLLVEFDDVENNPDYDFEDFNRMFASIDSYDDQTTPTPHPDNKMVFGSVHDYWDEMTLGDVNISGSVWNSSDWITLDYNKSYYDSNYESILINEIALKSGYNFSSLGTDHLCAILYAGNEYLGGTLHPHYSGGTYRYMMAAEFSRPQSQENSYNFFANIGTHCHELGHAAFGLPDRYGTYNTLQWDLMGVGNKNGPTNELACPATLNPLDREQNSWISFISFSGCDENKSIVYNYSSPQVLKTAQSGDDFFLIENRQKTTGFDRYLPNRGILVWHKFKIYSTTFLDLIEADNIQSSSTQTGDPFPGSTNNKHLND